MFGKPAEQIDSILKPLPPITKRKILEQMSELKPTPAEKSSCEMKLITEVRAISSSGIIKFEKFDADLFIEENIEDKIGNSDSGISYLSKIEVNYVEEVTKTTDIRETATAPQSSGSTSEVEAMKRKVTLLSQEISTLKHENSVLKDKLNQIKRIA
ncbi:MAG: hypothetical protein EOP04_19250 [Proteobacteria bacterium]|nr:MAG: hypothetical protein EOP04_19250 [Pseudomonadota bacterium]